METGSSAASQHDLDMTKLFILSMSFFVGVIITVVALGVFANEPVRGAAASQRIDTEDLARTVGEPGIAVEVAGIQCEAPQRTAEDRTPEGLLSLWNETVQSSGDECTPAFDAALGSEWLLSQPMLTVFNDSGSLYEVEITDDVVTGVAIYLVPTDAPRSADLQALLTTLWGAENVDWSRSCGDTDRPWSGLAVTDGLYLEVTSCELSNSPVVG